VIETTVAQIPEVKKKQRIGVGVEEERVGGEEKE